MTYSLKQDRIFLAFIVTPPCVLVMPIVVSWLMPSEATSSTLLAFITGSIGLSILATFLQALANTLPNPERNVKLRILTVYPRVAYGFNLLVWLIGALLSTWTWRSMMFITILYPLAKICLAIIIAKTPVEVEKESSAKIVT